MKTKTLSFFLLAFASHAFAGGIVFQHGTWAEIVKKATAANKPIFVDFYAVWCGPCKMMTRDVFTQETVGAFFNQNFISYKVDAEKEEVDLVGSISLEAYPTLVFFSPTGKMMHKAVGALDAEPLVSLAKQIASFESNRAMVLNGKATREQTIEYLAVAATADPGSFAKLAPGIVASFSSQELLDERAWKIFTAEVRDIHSPQFDLLTANHAQLIGTHPDYSEYVGGVMNTNLIEVAKSGNLKALDRYKEVLYAIVNNDQQKIDKAYVDLWANSDYYLQRNELSQYSSTLIQWVDGYMKNDWKKLCDNANALSTNVKTQASGSKALQWAQQAVKLDRNKESVYCLSKIYANIGQKEKALTTAQEILKFQLDEQEKAFVMNYIAELKG
jgi:thiol-disulfide isomerase/thioredoxin